MKKIRVGVKTRREVVENEPKRKRYGQAACKNKQPMSHGMAPIPVVLLMLLRRDGDVAPMVTKTARSLRGANPPNEVDQKAIVAADLKRIRRAQRNAQA